MKKSLSSITVLLLLLWSCEPAEVHVQCPEGKPALLIGHDYTNRVCGGNYIFVENESDTIRVRYDAVLRDFFLENVLSGEDFPIPVMLAYDSLDTADPCHHHLWNLACVSLPGH